MEVQKLIETQTHTYWNIHIPYILIHYNTIRLEIKLFQYFCVIEKIRIFSLICFSKLRKYLPNTEKLVSVNVNLSKHVVKIHNVNVSMQYKLTCTKCVRIHSILLSEDVMKPS